MKKLKPTSESITIEEDLISRLPDELIAHILSYIPTKSSVATSLLSKRWNLIWISVPNLDFGSYRRTIHESPVKKSRFFDFIDRVLTLNNLIHVRKVHLSCFDTDCEPPRAAAWLRSLAARDCEEFRVVLPRSCRVRNSEPAGSFIYSVPDSFFKQNNLAVLKLHNAVLKVPPLACFPRLKEIVFYNVQFPDDDSMKYLMAGCPVLTCLDIYGGIFHNVRTLYICSSTLNHLFFSGEYCDRDFGYNVVIDAPKLTDLSLMDGVGMNYDIVNLSSLVDAALDVGQHFKVSWAGFDERLFGLLRKTCHVKELFLTCGIMYSLGHVDLGNLPVFKNLIKLTVEFVKDGWPVLPRLFHCTPNLVTFVLELFDVHPHCSWSQPNEIPCFFQSKLEHVKITYFEECEEEMQMVSYLLKNAMVLKKLTIGSYYLDLVQETSIRTRLMALPRSSRACQVDYTNTRFIGRR